MCWFYWCWFTASFDCGCDGGVSLICFVMEAGCLTFGCLFWLTDWTLLGCLWVIVCLFVCFAVLSWFWVCCFNLTLLWVWLTWLILFAVCINVCWLSDFCGLFRFGELIVWFVEFCWLFWLVARLLMLVCYVLNNVLFSCLLCILTVDFGVLLAFNLCSYFVVRLVVVLCSCWFVCD